MTGTGTQNDPYVVGNFSDFVDAVGQNGVYVQLGSDIDVAADGYEYIGAITINAASVDGRGYAIRNATFQMSGGNYFATEYSGITISNLSILDCAFKASDNANIFGSKFAISNMKISAQVQNEKTFRISSGSSLDYVAADISLFGNTALTICEHADVKNSTFLVRGTLKSSNFLFYGTSGVGQINVQNVGIAIDAEITVYGTLYMGNYVNFAGCYFALNDGIKIIGNTSPTLNVNVSQYGGSATNFVFAVGDLAQGTVAVPSPRLTTAQMKSESYLQSIGWLP